MASDDTENGLSGRAWNSVQARDIHGDVHLTAQPEPDRRTRAGTPARDDEQADLLRHLAGAVRAGSSRELEKWGLRGPDALAVRWRTADDELHDHWDKIQDGAEPAALDGQYAAIRDTYEAVASRRLVILGRAGSGKTVLAHRLILDLLTDGNGPVPVLFSLSDWNPATELRRWMAEHLVRDYPFLDARETTTRRQQAELLLERGHVLPVLDGFDEIPDQHQRAAILRISSLDLPLIVTSRAGEYRRAARETKPVSGAAAITIEDLPPAQARHYLRSSTSRTRAAAWDAVFRHLDDAPDEAPSRNLTAALTSPLMVMLARTAYNDAPGDPAELLDAGRFPEVRDLENHLLDRYLDTVYSPDPRRPGWTPHQARRWLGHLASHLRERRTHDLTWWQLPATLHRRTRILATAASLGLIYWLATGPLDALSGHLPDSVSVFMDALRSRLVDAVIGKVMMALTNGIEAAIAASLSAALLVGLAVGLAVALINEAAFSRAAGGREPERMRLGRKQPGREPRSGSAGLKNLAFEFAGGLLLGLALGLLFGIAFGIAFGLAFGLGISVGIDLTLVLGLVIGLALGLAFGLSYGLVNCVVSTLGNPYDPHATAPWTLLNRDRAVTLVRIAAASSLGGWLATAIANGVMGTDFDSFAVVMLGLVAGIARMALSAWGSWLLFARLWLPLTGRLPWRPKRFLEDAYERGVLRRSGAVYQFRHARLRDHLADRPSR